MTEYPANLTVEDTEDLKRIAAEPKRHRDGHHPVSDNNANVQWAATALVTYIETVGDSGDLEITIGDLLGDLMHLCDSADIDFDSAYQSASHHYFAELRGED
ncbi:hypothetical protein MycrhDRAFT_5746 [Mycolicibacterium rhodesiae JS60]|nr:hypothetical protein MycrhDRAFT_5746 [Mycolicibacterium rhodesiae JS60]